MQSAGSGGCDGMVLPGYGVGSGSKSRRGDAVCYKHAVELKPNTAPSKPASGCCCSGAGDPDAAVAAFSKVVELTPSDPEAHNNLGVGFVAARRRRRRDQRISRSHPHAAPTIPAFRATWERLIYRKRISTQPIAQFRAALKNRSGQSEFASRSGSGAKIQR